MPIHQSSAMPSPAAAASVPLQPSPVPAPDAAVASARHDEAEEEGHVSESDTIVEEEEEVAEALEEAVAEPERRLETRNENEEDALEGCQCLLVENSRGHAVVVQRPDGVRWHFNQSHIQFELECDAEELSTWLDSLDLQQLPGLLTLLAHEVNRRGAELKAAEKDRDSLQGSEDYDFFGLDGEACTDKDIERAYRKKSAQLHPDKGGTDREFQDMREKYEQLKNLRNESKRKEGGGAIKWDTKSRPSMLDAHASLREQLVWITRHIEEVQTQLETLKTRQRTRFTLTWADAPCADLAAPEAALSASSSG